MKACTASTHQRQTAAERPVLLFDGVCHLCHQSVQFILRHERRPWILFAALQSDTGRALLQDVKMPPGYLDSLIFFENHKVFTRSEAALRVTGHLRLPWSCLGALRVVPRVLRDPLYDWIARHRYRWFGKDEEACLVPNTELRERFLR